MALTLTVATVTGKTYEVPCAEEDAICVVRENLQQHHIEVPPACFLKLFNGPQVLHDAFPVAKLDRSQPIFAVIGRETAVEILLQAAGSYQGYADIVKAAPVKEGTNCKVIEHIPSIIAVLEDMGGQKPELEHLKQGEHGLEMTSPDGHLLLPSLNVAAMLADSGRFSKVVVSIQLNSDAYNQGLGVVVEQPGSMDSEVDMDGVPKHIYNGLGLSKDKNSNAIKFHPGMMGGQLRIEGIGGFFNSDIGFNPQNWTASGNSFHTFEVSISTDGSNHLKVIGTGGEVWEAAWTNALTDGCYTPSFHAWLDLGGTMPLVIGEMKVEIHFDAAKPP